jgi:hypothetical protein
MDQSSEWIQSCYTALALGREGTSVVVADISERDNQETASFSIMCKQQIEREAY